MQFPETEKIAEEHQQEISRQLEIRDPALLGGVSYFQGKLTAVGVSTSNFRIVFRQESVLELDSKWGEAQKDFAIALASQNLLAKFPQFPGLLFVDGAGIAHVRKCGLASLIGFAVRIPTIGIQTSLPDCIVPPTEVALKRRGEHILLNHKRDNELVGVQILTMEGEEPLVVSPGCYLGVREAITTTLRFTPWHRFPASLRR